eukprot:TRINITY_DN43148_c0_g1_i1.p1 TRINITY_DN43148_c0_g1~~TRINITY_DN43148_c0_g1_i1.p1  ORF type:complete len:535 (-),score=82.52 TRINITY_DN43148_c0_g1_i1:147-1751(-)
MPSQIASHGSIAPVLESPSRFKADASKTGVPGQKGGSPTKGKGKGKTSSQLAKTYPLCYASRDSMELLLQRVAELEHGMESLSNNNTMLREQVETLKGEADHQRAENSEIREQLVEEKRRAQKSNYFRGNTKAPPLTGKGVSSFGANHGLHRGDSNSLVSPTTVYRHVPSTGLGQQPNSDGSPRSRQYEIEMPSDLPVDYYLDSPSKAAVSKTRRTGDPQSYTSRIKQESMLRIAMSSSNRKSLEAALKDATLGMPDDASPLDVVGRSLDDITRRQNIRRAISAQEHARCKLEQVLCHDRSALPRCGQWTSRSDRVEAFRQALRHGDLAIRLSEVAGLQVDRLRRSVEEISWSLIADAAHELEAAINDGSLPVLTEAMHEAISVGVPEECPSFVQARLMIVAAEQNQGDVSTGGAERVFQMIRERISTMKTKVGPFFNRFDADGTGELDLCEFRMALAKLGLVITDADLVAVVHKVGLEGSGVVSVRELCRELMGAEPFSSRVSPSRCRPTSACASGSRLPSRQTSPVNGRTRE